MVPRLLLGKHFFVLLFFFFPVYAPDCSVRFPHTPRKTGATKVLLKSVSTAGYQYFKCGAQHVVSEDITASDVRACLSDLLCCIQAQTSHSGGGFQNKENLFSSGNNRLLCIRWINTVLTEQKLSIPVLFQMKKGMVANNR